MSRLGSRGITVIAFALIMVCLGCGGSGTTSTTTTTVTPGIVTLSPSSDVSLEIGNTVSFTSAAESSSGTALTPSPLISFVSSNPSVVQIASSGLACAGKWDSLTNPQICTTGPVGEAVITAVSVGVSSPPTTVHVHQHIDSVAITPAPTQTAPASCLSKGLTQDFQVAAFNRGIDITSTVGPFNWNVLNQTVATLATTGSGLTTGNARITAAAPGLTSFFASVAGVTSPTVQFITCPVVSISLAITNTNQTSFIEASGTKSITATVYDSSNTLITPNLTWSTSDAAAFTASGTTTGSAGSVKAGSATVIATCQPPLCNVGFPTPKVIYPENVITGTATTGTTTTAATAIVWLASTQCGTPDPITQVVVNRDDCISTVAPLDTSTNALGAAVDLPAIPDSIQFSRQGTSLFLGTDSGRLGAVGLSVVTPGANAQAASTLQKIAAAPGKILAVSANGANVIVSDTADTPNQVFVATTTSVAATLPITNATAASFSPDGSKAFIVASSPTATTACSTPPCGLLYVYSSTEALKKIALPSVANDITFLSNGAFAYLAGGGASGHVATYKTCDDNVARDAGGNVQETSFGAAPRFIKTMPDGTKVVGLLSSGLSLLNIASAPVDCAPPSAGALGGFPTVSNGAVTPFNFGVGNVTPSQFILHSSGSRAYILASDFNNIIVFNFDTQSTSTIQLTGNSVPLQASLSTDGKNLYVVAHDLTTNVNSLHVVDTTINADVNQILIAQSLCHAASGLTQTFTCQPDLVAVKP